MKTDVAQLLEDLDGGIFIEKLSATLSEVAENVLAHGAAGKVTINLEMKQIDNSSQVSMTHKLAYQRPTKRGKVQEEDQTSTPLYVNRGGKLTLFPEGSLHTTGDESEKGPLFDQQQEENS
jgi:hypothetical protein